MLKGIPWLICPELLKALSEMEHGNEVVLADTHFSAKTFNSNILRLDSVKITPLLSGILSLFELDNYSTNPLVMISAVEVRI